MTGLVLWLRVNRALLYVYAILVAVFIAGAVKSLLLGVHLGGAVVQLAFCGVWWAFLEGLAHRVRADIRRCDDG